MDIGNFVTCPIYAEKKQGKIVDINAIDGTRYLEVYFPRTKEVLTLEEKDLKKVYSPTERLKDRKYDHPLLFQLRILAEKIDSLIYQDKIIVANNFNIIPLPHQVLTINHVLDQFKPRCLIADEVGLGKTIEAALIFEELKMRKIVDRVLIITPSNLTSQWQEELKTKFNEEEFIIMNGETFKSLKKVHGENNVWAQYNQVITSIDYLKPRPLSDLLSDKINEGRKWHNDYVCSDCVDAQWDMVIIDEAHNLSKSTDGGETLRYKIGKCLADVTPILLLLTATPHQGDSGRFRYLLSLIDEYQFFDENSLTPENVKSVTIKNHKRAVTDFQGNLIFKSRIVSIVKIPRVKEDIEFQLYDKVTDYVSKYYNLASQESNFPYMFLLILFQRMVSSSSRAIYYSLNKRLNQLRQDLRSSSYLKKMDISELRDVDAQSVYDKMIEFQEEQKYSKHGNYHVKSYMKEELRILEECVALAKKSAFGRQDFKLRKLLETIDSVIERENDPKTKFIIFTEFIATQKYIGETLENLGYKVAYFNGKMSLDDKIEAKSLFNDDYQFLISTDSGGEGINLQFCHVMINYDLPWNPMKIEQRIGRLDRIGQEKDVLIFNFILSDTVEERVREVLDSKLNRIADEFGDDKRKDVLSLLQDEYNFDKIYMEAVKQREIDEKQLEKTGINIYLEAKKILEKQDLLVPFTEVEDKKKIEECMVENEESIIKKLVETYADYMDAELKQYTKKKNVFYVDQPLKGLKMRNLVFDPNLALEDEKYQYVNLNHPLIKRIVDDILDDDSLSFDLEINGYNQYVKGNLFYYRVELTNNEGFVRRYLMPLFIDQRGIFDNKVTHWFESNYEFNFNVDIKDDLVMDIEKLRDKSEKILEAKIKDVMSSTKLELREKIEKEQTKFDKYYHDKKSAFERIKIDNIREFRLRNLEEQRAKEKLDLQKKKNLVPNIKLFAVAEVTLKP